jgi:hypothetical protein
MKAYKEKQMADQEKREAERKPNTEKTDPNERTIANFEQMIECLLARQEELKAKADADQEKMLARMSANMKTMQEKADADRKANRENLKEMMKANTKAMQERMERQIGSLLSDRDEFKQEIRADREQMLAKMEANTKATQARMDATLKDLKEDIISGEAEVRFIVRAFHEKMDTCVASWRDDREETMPCEETMEPCLECEEPISVDMKACQGMTAWHEVTETDTEKIEPDPGMMQSVVEHQVAPKDDAIVKLVKGWKKRHRGRKPAAGRRGEPKEMSRGDCGAGRKLAATCRKVSSCATVAW